MVKNAWAMTGVIRRPPFRHPVADNKILVKPIKQTSRSQGHFHVTLACRGLQ
jgi:CDP-diacylglycerol pyrophosphatase